MKLLLKGLGFIMLFAAIMITSSCDEDGNSIIPLPSMKATVDGEAWVSLFRATVLVESTKTITITGTPDYTKDVDKMIVLTIKGDAAGTYSLSAVNATAQCLIVYKKKANAVDGDSNYFTSTNATITITKIDKEKKQVSGTFSGTLYAIGVATPVNITNGKFEILNYTVQ